VLDLPRIGPMVRDYRAGLGMSRRAKAFAIAVMWVFVAASILLTVDNLLIAAVIGTLAVVGTAYILLRVPTRERVLERMRVDSR
jgi:uncharacterized membrane protein YbaN (DUF454 family)